MLTTDAEIGSFQRYLTGPRRRLIPLLQFQMTQSVPVLPQPYLLFLGDVNEAGNAKTAFGLRDWARERCVGEFACDGTSISTGLPFLTPAQAVAQGARSLVVGVANEGGFIAEAWISPLVNALDAGLDIISG